MGDIQGAKPLAQMWGKTRSGVMGRGSPREMESRKLREKPWDSYHCGGHAPEMGLEE